MNVLRPYSARDAESGDISAQLGGELSLFVGDRSLRALLIAPPRGGKTEALAARARLIGLPILWAGAALPESAPPPLSRSLRLLAWGASQYARFNDALRVVDYEELRRFFTQEASDLPGSPGPWFEAYCALQRTNALDTKRTVISVIQRHQLATSGAGAAEFLLEAAVRVERRLAQAGAITPWSAARVVASRIETAPRLAGALLAPVHHLCVDDIQLLSRPEIELLMAIAAGGVRVSATLGSVQCFNARDGAAGHSCTERLRARGFNLIHTRRAPGLTRAQVRTLSTGAGLFRNPPAESVSDAPFALRYSSHKDESAAYDALAAEVTADGDQLERGQVAVLVPFAEYARTVADALAIRRVPVALRGRRTISASPGYLVACAVVTAVRAPSDLVALRQVATLWLDELAMFDRVAAAACAGGTTLAEAARHANGAERFSAMDEWLDEIARGSPADIPEQLRKAPHWASDAVVDAGVRAWESSAAQLGCLSSWDHPAWAEVCARPVDGHAVEDPHVPGAVVVAPLQDCVGIAWESVEFVGMSEGLFPARVTDRDERQIEGHGFIHLVSRASSRLHLHHIKKMALGPDGESVKLRASVFAVGLGLERESGQQPRPDPRYGPSESFRP